MPQPIVLSANLPFTDPLVRTFAQNVAAIIDLPLAHGPFRDSGTSATHTITLQVRNRRKDPLAGTFLVFLWISETNGAAPGGVQTVTFSSGFVVQTMDADRSWIMLTDSNGQVTMNVTLSTVATRYFNSVVVGRPEVAHVSWQVSGWTTLAPSADSRLIYVSSIRGNNATAINYTLADVGPDAQHPNIVPLCYATLNVAKNQLRAGHDDWIIMESGSVFAENLFWPAGGGLDAAHPQVLTRFGTGPRPIIRNPAPIVTNETVFCSHRNYVWFVDFELQNDPAWIAAPDGSLAQGMSVDGCTGILIEGVKATHFSNNFNILNNTDIKIRRNVLYETLGGPTNARQNLYLSGNTNLLVEENLFDRAAYNDATVTLANRAHNVYCGVDNVGVIFRRNISSRAWNATQIRSGGIVEKNLTIDCSDHLFCSGADPAGIRVLRYNVALGAKDVPGGVAGAFPRGVAFTIIGYRSGVPGLPTNNYQMYSNISSGAGGTVTSTSAIAPFVVSATFNAGAGDPPVAMTGADVHGNIGWQWRNDAVGLPDTSGGVQIYGDATNNISNLRVHDNDIQNGGAGYCIDLAFMTDIPGFVLSGNRYWSTSPASAFDGVTYAAWIARVAAFTGGSSETSPTPAVYGGYPDPNRNLRTYLASKGVPVPAGATNDQVTDIYIAKARAQEKSSWLEDWTAEAGIDYIRAGFGLSPPP